MKINFIEREKFIGKVGVARLWEWDKKGVISKNEEAGFYSFNIKEIMVVKQKYWYMTLFILAHELCHWIIDYIFPYKNTNCFDGEFEFDRDKNNKPILENGIFLSPKKVTRKPHILHTILDDIWKLPDRWVE